MFEVRTSLIIGFWLAICSAAPKNRTNINSENKQIAEVVLDNMIRVHTPFCLFTNNVTDVCDTMRGPNSTLAKNNWLGPLMDVCEPGKHLLGYPNLGDSFKKTITHFLKQLHTLSSYDLKYSCYIDRAVLNAVQAISTAEFCWFRELFCGKIHG